MRNMLLISLRITYFVVSVVVKIKKRKGIYMSCYYNNINVNKLLFKQKQ